MILSAKPVNFTSFYTVLVFTSMYYVGFVIVVIIIVKINGHNTLLLMYLVWVLSWTYGWYNMVMVLLPVLQLILVLLILLIYHSCWCISYNCSYADILANEKLATTPLEKFQIYHVRQGTLLDGPCLVFWEVFVNNLMHIVQS